MSTHRNELVVDHPQTGPRSARLRKANLTPQPDLTSTATSMHNRGCAHRLCLSTSMETSSAMVSKPKPPMAFQPALVAHGKLAPVRTSWWRALSSQGRRVLLSSCPRSNKSHLPPGAQPPEDETKYRIHIQTVIKTFHLRRRLFQN